MYLARFPRLLHAPPARISALRQPRRPQPAARCMPRHSRRRSRSRRCRRRRRQTPPPAAETPTAAEWAPLPVRARRRAVRDHQRRRERRPQLPSCLLLEGASRLRARQTERAQSGHAPPPRPPPPPRARRSEPRDGPPRRRARSRRRGLRPRTRERHLPAVPGCNRDHAQCCARRGDARAAEPASRSARPPSPTPRRRTAPRPLSSTVRSE